jgi:hypothetical protein
MGVLMPLPNSRVVLPRWSQHHRPTASGTMTGACRITRITGEGTTGPDGTWTPPDETTVYTGPCRVVAATNDGQYLTGEQTQLTRRDYDVAVEWDAAVVAIGDTVTVTSARDPRLTGMQFRVQDVRHGTEQWQRNLLCEEIEGRVTGA